MSIRHSLVCSVLMLFLWTAAQATQIDSSKSDYELQKIEQEVIKLKLENDRLSKNWEPFSNYSPLIASLVAMAGVFITIWKHLSERSRQQALDRQQAEAERVQRFDDRFTAVVENLGSSSQSVKASAAVSIVTFLKPEYADFHDQIFLVLLANLKVAHDEVVRNLLISGFEKVARIKAMAIAALNNEIEEKEEKIVLDFSNCILDGINLSELDLSWSNLREASLSGANLKKTVLFHAHGNKVHFESANLSEANLQKCRFENAYLSDAKLSAANLISAHLENADMTGAQMQQARLQSAHLNGAHLERASFEQADLNDTFFIGASFDAKSKASIVKAFNWRKAHFDPEIKAELEAIETHIRASSTETSG